MNTRNGELSLVSCMRSGWTIWPATARLSGSIIFRWLSRRSEVSRSRQKVRWNHAPIGAAIRTAIAGIDPELALFDFHTMADRADLSMAVRKTPMALALGFGGLALFLSAIGIYGVLTHRVTQRRREIGIRLALGCSVSKIVGLVVSEGLLLVGTGLILGLAGAVALRKALENQLYGEQPLDPIVMTIVTAVLGLVALAACLLPAQRATRVDPVVVLKEH
jgi:predicted lysophospholipase L1 biosynthesis ABC-type transport system permease subunit